MSLFMFSLGAKAAYIDPGASSYIIQIVAAAVIAVGAVVGVYINKIKRSIKKVGKKDGEGADEAAIESIREMKKDSEGGTVTADDLLSDD